MPDMRALTSAIFIWPRRWIAWILCGSALRISQKISLRNTISCRPSTMDGSTSKLSRDATVSPRTACCPTTYSASASISQGNTIPPPRPAFGTTNGAPLCLSSLWTILASSMWATATFTTSAQSSPTTTLSTSTGNCLLASTSTGTIPRTTTNSHVAYPWMAILTNLSSSLGTKPPPNLKISPHRHRDIVYGSKQQLVTEEDTSPKITKAGIKRVQAIEGDLLYYARTTSFLWVSA